MQFNVADLLKDTTGATREHDIDESVDVDGQPRMLTGRVRFDRTHDGILVRAVLRGEEDAMCSRCLRPLSYAIEVAFDEQYIPMIDIISGAKITPPEGDDDAYRISERHMLDLGEPIQQYWAMSRPMAPLCRPDCPGLCPICGSEALEGHACAPDTADERWSKLRNLKLG